MMRIHLKFLYTFKLFDEDAQNVIISPFIASEVLDKQVVVLGI